MWLSPLPGVIPIPQFNRRVQIGYNVPETKKRQTDVCYEATKTPSLVVYPQEEGRSGKTSLWTLAPPEDHDMVGTF